MAETPRFAHLFVLVFVGVAFCVALCLAVAFYGALRKSNLLARFGTVGALIGLAGYAGLLLSVGLLTPSKTLNPGQWKYFCEVDCHIAYSIADVRVASTLGSELNPLTAKGHFVVVQLKTWFDENSISKFRGDGTLTPSPRVVTLRDATGQVFSPSLAGEAALGEHSTPLARPLRPGESYLTTLVFDVPADAKDLRLLVADSDPMASLIIDHENSPLHGRIFLAVETKSAAAASRGSK